MVDATKVGLILLLLAAACSGQTANQDKTVAGVVLGPNGNPLENVEVTGNHHNEGGGYEAIHSRTDSSGQFRLEDVGRVISFRQVGYRPLTVMAEANKPVSVTLQDDASSTWQLPVCKSLARGEKEIWFDGIRVTVPKGVRIKTKTGTDTYEHLIFFNGDKKQYLAAWLGPGNYTLEPPLFSGFPYEPSMLRSTEWSERTISHEGEIIAVEAQGHTIDGSQWRSIRTLAGLTYYPPVTTAAAAFFDDILNTGCVESDATARKAGN